MFSSNQEGQGHLIVKACASSSVKRHSAQANLRLRINKLLSASSAWHKYTMGDFIGSYGGALLQPNPFLWGTQEQKMELKIKHNAFSSFWLTSTCGWRSMDPEETPAFLLLENILCCPLQNVKLVGTQHGRTLKLLFINGCTFSFLNVWILCSYLSNYRRNKVFLQCSPNHLNKVKLLP